MWVLIFLATFHYSDNISVTHVDGFQSREMCQSAGEAAANAAKTLTSRTLLFTCAPKVGQ